MLFFLSLGTNWSSASLQFIESRFITEFFNSIKKGPPQSESSHSRVSKVTFYLKKKIWYSPPQKFSKNIFLTKNLTLHWSHFESFFHYNTLCRGCGGCLDKINNIISRSNNICWNKLWLIWKARRKKVGFRYWLKQLTAGSSFGLNWFSWEALLFKKKKE